MAITDQRCYDLTQTAVSSSSLDKAWKTIHQGCFSGDGQGLAERSTSEIAEVP